MLSALRCHAVCYIHQWGLNHWGLHHCSPLEHTLYRHMSNLVMAISQCQKCTKWPLSLLMLLGQLSSSHSNNIVGHTDLGAQQRVT